MNGIKAPDDICNILEQEFISQVEYRRANREPMK